MVFNSFHGVWTLGESSSWFKKTFLLRIVLNFPVSQFKDQYHDPLFIVTIKDQNTTF